jgi:hypothetical protein
VVANKSITSHQLFFLWNIGIKIEQVLHNMRQIKESFQRLKEYFYKNFTWKMLLFFREISKAKSRSQECNANYSPNDKFKHPIRHKWSNYFGHWPYSPMRILLSRCTVNIDDHKIGNV